MQHVGYAGGTMKNIIENDECGNIPTYITLQCTYKTNKLKGAHTYKHNAKVSKRILIPQHWPAKCLMVSLQCLQVIC